MPQTRCDCVACMFQARMERIRSGLDLVASPMRACTAWGGPRKRERVEPPPPPEEEEYPNFLDSYDGPDRIWEYGYKPNPVFHGQGPVFLGWELELAVPDRELYRAARTVNSDVGPMVYLKADGSISSGFEIVSHPMSYAWALGHFPWEVIQRLRTDHGARATSQCGLHVHVNRDAFSTPSHTARWMQLLYRNPGAIRTLSRREPGALAQWARLDDRSAEAERKRIVGYVKDQQPSDRYVAINTRPSNTFEVRLFASTTSPRRLQAALALVDASVRYAGHLTAADVMGKKALAWGAFSDWVQDRASTYGPLAREMERI